MSDTQQNSDPGLSDLSLSEILADAELCAEIEKWSAPFLAKEGEMLFRQGDNPNYAFFVKAGEIALTMNVSRRCALDSSCSERFSRWFACHHRR
jgi:CRP-like cAMP-binding protein